MALTLAPSRHSLAGLPWILIRSRPPPNARISAWRLAGVLLLIWPCLSLLFTLSGLEAFRGGSAHGRCPGPANLRVLVQLGTRVGGATGLPVSGQGWRLQERYLRRRPWQYLPPYCGAGLLHSLLASSTPPPQLREQPPYGLQAPQRPFTCPRREQRPPASDGGHPGADGREGTVSP